MNQKKLNWDEFYMKMCDLVAKKSKDYSTKVGCVIVGEGNEVVSIGYNSFPRGINDDLEERQERPKKYFFFCHSEENAILNAARTGAGLKGCRIYVSWCPCAPCARLIIQSGIKEIIVKNMLPPQTSNSKKWIESCEAALEMLNERGIPIREMGISENA